MATIKRTGESYQVMRNGVMCGEYRTYGEAASHRDQINGVA